MLKFSIFTSFIILLGACGTQSNDDSKLATHAKIILSIDSKAANYMYKSLKLPVRNGKKTHKGYLSIRCRHGYKPLPRDRVTYNSCVLRTATNQSPVLSYRNGQDDRNHKLGVKIYFGLKLKEKFVVGPYVGQKSMTSNKAGIHCTKSKCKIFVRK